MKDTVLDERGAADGLPRAGAVISGRSLLLRSVIAVVVIAALSMGGAWLMYDPAAEAMEGADTSARETPADLPSPGR